MSLFRRALGGAERRGMPFLTNYGDGYYGDPTYYGDGAIPPNSWIPTTSSGAAVTEQTSLQLSIFYACVRLLADSIAALPWEVYRTTGETRTRVVDPEPQIVRQPFPEVSTFDWKHMLVVSMAMRGNAYGYVAERDRLGYPTSILPLHPDWVVINRDPKTGERICWVNGQREPYEDLFHIKWFTLPGFDIALSPLQIFRQSIGMGLAAEEFGGKWFRDGAAPSSTLETEQVLTDDQIKQTQRQWVASQGGKRLPAVLSGGFKWKPVTITPEESQFLETQKFQVAQIARVFGIPPHMVGDVDRSTSWGCLPGDALVFTTTGPVPIEDVKPGDEVWSYNNDAGMVPAKVTAWQMTGYKSILTIKTTSRDLRATSNHRVPIRRYFGMKDGRKQDETGWETVEVSAGEIKIGDYLLVPHGMGDGERDMAPNGRKLTVEAMEFCGLYLGDGSSDLNRMEIAHEVDPDHMDYYSQVIRDEFGVEPYVDKRGTRTRFSSTPARELLECGFTGNAHTKRVPDWVFRLAPDLQLALLRGYLDADGSIQRGRIVYSSANKMLLEDMRHLCIQLGVPVGRVVLARKGGPMSIKGGRTYIAQDKYHLALSSVPFNSRIGSNSPHKAANLITEPTTRRLRYDDGWTGTEERGRKRPESTVGGTWPHSNVVLQRVTSIEKGDVEIPVYDITVADHAHFVSDGVVVHNTGIEQMSVGFVTYTLGPWIARIESAFNGILPRGQELKFNVEGLLRGDIAARYSAYQMGLDSGFLCPDEVRAKEDLEPIPGGKGKLFRQPLNFGPLGYDPTQHPAPNPSGTNLPVQKAPSSKQPTSKQPASTPKSGTPA